MSQPWWEPMVSMRRFAVLSAALIVVGCAEAERAYVRSPPAEIAASKTDCSPIPYGSFYSPRHFVMLAVRAREAVSDSSYLFHASETVWGAEKREEREERARVKAREIIDKLDDLDRNAEAAMAKDRDCFDAGVNAKEVVKRYYQAKQTIAEQKKAVAEALEKLSATNRTIAEEQAHFDRWRADNQERLVHNAGGMKLEIIRITKRPLFGQQSPETIIAVEVTNTTTSKILKPRNQRVWGYEFGSDVGGRLPVGVSLTDSFGNDYKLTSIYPGFLGSEAAGIRPGQTVPFQLRFGDVPLQNAKSVRLTIAPRTFGQESGTVFVLPLDAFYGAAASR